jgi:hypothetical protein
MRAFYFLALVLSVPAAFGQKSPYEEDTRALSAAGKLENKIYSNQHAGFTVHLPLTPCIPQLNTQTDLQKGSATLLECVHDVEGGAYTFSIFIDSWTRYNLVSVEQYIRGLQRLGETDPKDRSKLDPNTKVIEPQTPRTWAGLDFRELIMSIQMQDGTGTHYMGVTCTHLKEYVLCFKGHSGSVEMVRGLLKLDHKLEVAPLKPARPSALHSPQSALPHTGQ